MHVPAEQVLPLEHWFPHIPQLAVSVWVSTQLLLHGTRPVGHAQAPRLQVCPVPHTTLQPPQFLASFSVEVHWSLHSVWPFGQLQDPSTHERPVAQGALHWPQCRTLVARSTQLLPHGVRSVPHSDEHWPAEQNCPTGHATPQPPQLSASLFGSMQAPEQLVSPCWHWHIPSRHDPPIWQPLPQLPQLLASVSASTHATAQLKRPAGH